MWLQRMWLQRMADVKQAAHVWIMQTAKHTNTNTKRNKKSTTTKNGIKNKCEQKMLQLQEAGATLAPPNRNPPDHQGAPYQPRASVNVMVYQKASRKKICVILLVFYSDIEQQHIDVANVNSRLPLVVWTSTASQVNMELLSWKR